MNIDNSGFLRIRLHIVGSGQADVLDLSSWMKNIANNMSGFWNDMQPWQIPPLCNNVVHWLVGPLFLSCCFASSWMPTFSAFCCQWQPNKQKAMWKNRLASYLEAEICPQKVVLALYSIKHPGVYGKSNWFWVFQALIDYATKVLNLLQHKTVLKTIICQIRYYLQSQGIIASSIIIAIPL